MCGRCRVSDCDEWRFEAKLGQSVTVKLDAVHAPLSDDDDDVRLHIQAAAALLSTQRSTSSVLSATHIKVCRSDTLHAVTTRNKQSSYVP